MFQLRGLSWLLSISRFDMGVSITPKGRWRRMKRKKNNNKRNTHPAALKGQSSNILVPFWNYVDRRTTSGFNIFQRPPRFLIKDDLLRVVKEKPFWKDDIFRIIFI
jgi:hypothetical protein